MTDDAQLGYRVIDMHTHMGREHCLYYGSHGAAEMVSRMDELGVEWIACSPCEDLLDASSERNQIVAAMHDYPDRIRGYYCVNPNLGIELHEIEDAFASNPGYIGFKLLPDYHRTPLSSDLYRTALEFADKRELVVLSHTWGVSMNGERCNSADQVAFLLDKYKRINFIMGHSCQGQVDAAIDIARNYKNAWLDLCDTGRLNGVIEKMVKTVGAERILFGTDFPLQSEAYQLGCVIGSRIDQREKKLILRDNAERLISGGYKV